jgi:hypothetical protein
MAGRACTCRRGSGGGSNFHLPDDRITLYMLGLIRPIGFPTLGPRRRDFLREFSRASASRQPAKALLGSGFRAVEGGFSRGPEPAGERNGAGRYPTSQERRNRRSLAARGTRGRVVATDARTAGDGRRVRGGETPDIARQARPPINPCAPSPKNAPRGPADNKLAAPSKTARRYCYLGMGACQACICLLSY